MSAEDVTAMQSEIEIMQKVDHPNIVKMFNVYEDEGHYCLIMELMQGGEVSNSNQVFMTLKCLAIRLHYRKRDFFRKFGATDDGSALRCSMLLPWVGDRPQRSEA